MNLKLRLDEEMPPADWSFVDQFYQGSTPNFTSNFREFKGN